MVWQLVIRQFSTLAFIQYHIIFWCHRNKADRWIYFPWVSKFIDKYSESYIYMLVIVPFRFNYTKLVISIEIHNDLDFSQMRLICVE